MADDDDKKLQDKKPAVVSTVWRNPDPWKLLSREGPIGNSGDATFPTRNMQLLSWLPLNTFAGFTSGANGADCWGYTSPSGREYALMGLSWGNGIVEVTNPASPQMVITIPGGVDVLWRDITVVGHYAYAVSDSSGVGIQVMDLSQIDNGIVTLVRNYSQGGHTTTHTLLHNPDSGYLYACGGNVANGGFKPIALTPDPTFPTFTGVNWTTSYVHEALISSYTSGPYAGREIAFLFRGSSSSGRISIVDVTNKASLVTLSSVSYPGANYSHQGWLSPDKKYLYHNDEIDSPTQTSSVPRMLTRVFDVSDLSMPRLVTAFSNGLPSVDHNEYTSGRYLYQSNYTSGFRVWDMHDPLRPVEVAFIDTRPENDGTGYNGCWGSYPYFQSGTILISDIERGLFIARLALLEFTPSTPLPAVLTPGQPTPVSIDLEEVNATFQSGQLFVSVNGAPYTSTPMSYQSGSLSGEIPAMACGDRVRYYIRAAAPENNEYFWPLRGVAEPLTAYAQAGQSVLYAENFQTGTGWTVQNTTVSAGAWTRAVPMTNGGPGAVIGDADGSGQCYMTGNTANADLDGGPTQLLSPALDLSAAPEARVSYSRWLLSLVGINDALVTEISGNDGATWTTVESLSPTTGGWRNHTFRVADYVTPTAQVRVRFSVADADNSTTEAGIDAFSVIVPTCATACYANCDDSTAVPVLNVGDFTCFLQRYAAGEAYANCDQSTAPPVLNVADFTCFLQQYAAGCP